jgi:hypothetical protein
MTTPEVSTPYAGTAAPSGAAATSTGRALGIWSLILGLLALAGVIVAAVAVVTAAQSLEADINTGLQNLFGAVVLAGVLMVGGFIAGIVGLILGIMAVARNRGRALGVAGMVLSILVSLGWIIAIIVSVGTGGMLTSFAEWV